jgi:hypothetical protein
VSGISSFVTRTYTSRENGSSYKEELAELRQLVQSLVSANQNAVKHMQKANNHVFSINLKQPNPLGTDQGSGANDYDDMEPFSTATTDEHLEGVSAARKIIKTEKNLGDVHDWVNEVSASKTSTNRRKQSSGAIVSGLADLGNGERKEGKKFSHATQEPIRGDKLPCSQRDTNDRHVPGKEKLEDSSTPAPNFVLYKPPLYLEKTTETEKKRYPADQVANWREPPEDTATWLYRLVFGTPTVKVRDQDNQNMEMVLELDDGRLQATPASNATVDKILVKWTSADVDSNNIETDIGESEDRAWSKSVAEGTRRLESGRSPYSPAPGPTRSATASGPYEYNGRWSEPRARRSANAAASPPPTGPRREKIYSSPPNSSDSNEYRAYRSDRFTKSWTETLSDPRARRWQYQYDRLRAKGDYLSSDALSEMSKKIITLNYTKTEVDKLEHKLKKEKERNKKEEARLKANRLLPLPERGTDDNEVVFTSQIDPTWDHEAILKGRNLKALFDLKKCSNPTLHQITASLFWQPGGPQSTLFMALSQRNWKPLWVRVTRKFSISM